MRETKERIPLWLYPSTTNLMDSLLALNNCKSRSEFIEKAVVFYSGYITAVDKNEFVPEIMSTMFAGIVENSEDRIARLLFKMVVEQNMMMRMISSQFEITDDMFGELRRQAIEDVKKSNGNISLKEINRSFDT